MERPGDVCIHHHAPVSVADGFETAVDANPGVVDHDIEPSEGRRGRRHGALNRYRIAYIEHLTNDASSPCRLNLQRLDCGIDSGPIAAGHGHAPIRHEDRPRDRAPDPSGAAGDECAL